MEITMSMKHSNTTYAFCYKQQNAKEFTKIISGQQYDNQTIEIWLPIPFLLITVNL